MKIATNQRMDRIVNMASFDLEAINLCADLAEFIRSGVTQVDDDIYFFKAQIDEGFDPTLAKNQYFDKTDMECSINHIHIDDFVAEDNLLPQGVKFAVELYLMIKEFGEFEVILSFSREPIEECTVRFHKVRLEEQPYLLELDGYQDEAILVIT